MAGTTAKALTPRVSRLCQVAEGAATTGTRRAARRRLRCSLGHRQGPKRLRNVSVLVNSHARKKVSRDMLYALEPASQRPGEGAGQGASGAWGWFTKLGTCCHDLLHQRGAEPHPFIPACNERLKLTLLS